MALEARQNDQNGSNGPKGPKNYRGLKLNSSAFVVINASRCNLCQDSGFVTAISRDDGLHYAFRCLACQAAEVRRLSDKIPEWSKWRLPEYYLWGDDPGPATDKN